MKATVCSHTRYPNEANKTYFRQKLLDGITSVITALGAITFFVYFLNL